MFTIRSFEGKLRHKWAHSLKISVIFILSIIYKELLFNKIKIYKKLKNKKPDFSFSNA